MEGRGKDERIGAEIRICEEKLKIIDSKREVEQKRIFIDNNLT